MSYITTSSGLHFDPVAPQEELIRITDIAHSLSLICRANGHVRLFYSVAQHSIACALEARERGYSTYICLGCLLHDASEAYLSDVTRPIKGMLTEYLTVEDRLQDMIWKRFMGRVPDEEDRRLIFGVDDDMLSYEFHHLMPEDYGQEEQWRRVRAVIPVTLRPFDEVETEFLELFEELDNMHK